MSIAPNPMSAGSGSTGNKFEIVVGGVVNGLRLYSAVATYDPNVIRVTAVENVNAIFTLCAGLLTTTGGGATGEAGDVAFEATCGATAEVALPTGDVTVARITFDCVATGTSSIAFNTSDVDSVEGGTVTLPTTNGAVTCG